jgi:hypothetical protein
LVRSKPEFTFRWAEQASKNYRDVMAQLGLLSLDTSVPEAVRAMTDKAVAQTREVYDRSKDALDASIEMFERTFDAAGQGAATFNRKIIDLGGCLGIEGSIHDSLGALDTFRRVSRAGSRRTTHS